MSVQENQVGPCVVPGGHSAQIRGVDILRRIYHQWTVEVGCRQGTDAGVLPLLIATAGGGKPQLVEPGPCLPAQVSEPLRVRGFSFLQQRVEAGPVGFEFHRCLSHSQNARRRRLHPGIDGFLDPVVTPLFQFMGQFGASGPHDTAVYQDVDLVGGDVVEDPLVVGHQNDGVGRVT